MIQVEHLKKDYQRVKRREGFLGGLRTLFSAEYETTHAVDDISFHINEGELVGYIGPNGAGKSTSIKMLCGILVPTSGQIEVNGLVPHKNRMENARQIRAVKQEAVPGELTFGDTLDPTPYLNMELKPETVTKNSQSLKCEQP